MTKSQENKSTRNYKVIDVANEYPTVWDRLPAFKTGMEKFISINAAIDSQAAIQKQNITGIAIDKELKKEQLVKLMLIVSGGVQAYARQEKNNELYIKMAFTKSKLMRARDTDIKGGADLIAETATALAVALVPFGITAAMVDALKVLAEDYQRNFLSKPETAINNRKTITEKTLPQLFLEGDTLLKDQLLKLVVQFNAENPEFVSKFIYATFIGTAGVRHTRLSILVNLILESDVTENIIKPIENALVLIEDTGLSGNTNEKGKLTISKVPEKATTVKVIYNNTTIEKKVKFERGKATRLTVSFEGEFNVPEGVAEEKALVVK